MQCAALLSTNLVRVRELLFLGFLPRVGLVGGCLGESVFFSLGGGGPFLFGWALYLEALTWDD